MSGRTRQFTPRSRKAWRDWLQKNHASAEEVWLVFFKKGAGRPTLTYDDAVEEALCFGWIDGVRRRLDEDRYTHRFSPRKPDSRWSPLNKKRAEKLRGAGHMTAAGERAIEHARRSGAWDNPVAAQKDVEMPPELAAALGRDKKASAFFESLAPSQKRQYMGWIASAKREETRRKRLSEAMRRLRNGEKLGMV